MSAGKTNVKLIRGLGDTEYIHADLHKHRFPMHFHDTFVIELVLAGVDWCSGADLSASQDEVYVHFPFAAHTGGTIGAGLLVYSAIYPSLDLFSRLTGVAPKDVPTGQTLVSKDAALVKELRDLFAVCDQREGKHSAAERQLRNVFEMIYREYSRSQVDDAVATKAPIYQKMLVAREYLLSNFTRDITTTELSDHCDVSQYHLIRSFKSHFGITPRQFLICQRVARAKQLIAGGFSVTSAAYSTGFADQSHLSRNFKKITSYSPRQIKC